MLMNCSYDSKKCMSMALFMLSIGLLVASCGVSWTHIAPHLHLSADMNDTIRGFCFGVGITLEIESVVIGSVVLMRKLGNRPRTN